jgi:pteridine reductase
VDLTGCTALVTGGALRVGREISLELGRRGANVVVNYLSSAWPAAQLVNDLTDLGVRGLAVRADVSIAADVHSLRVAAEEEFGPVQLLINNASIFPRTPLATLTEEDWDRSMAVNLKAPFLCSLEFGRRMVEEQQGAIINIADWAVNRPYLEYLPYLVAKGGIETLTRAFAVELAPYVRVNAIAPGPIAPPPDLPVEEIDESRRGTLLNRWGSPSDIAAAVVFLIEGSDFITGAILPVDGGRTIA